jgi:hypothetical protein
VRLEQRRFRRGRERWTWPQQQQEILGVNITNPTGNFIQVILMWRCYASLAR